MHSLQQEFLYSPKWAINRRHIVTLGNMNNLMQRLPSRLHNFPPHSMSLLATPHTWWCHLQNLTESPLSLASWEDDGTFSGTLYFMLKTEEWEAASLSDASNLLHPSPLGPSKTTMKPPAFYLGQTLTKTKIDRNYCDTFEPTKPNSPSFEI